MKLCIRLAGWLAGWISVCAMCTRAGVCVCDLTTNTCTLLPFISFFFSSFFPFADNISSSSNNKKGESSITSIPPEIDSNAWHSLNLAYGACVEIGPFALNCVLCTSVCVFYSSCFYLLQQFFFHVWNVFCPSCFLFHFVRCVFLCQWIVTMSKWFRIF